MKKLGLVFLLACLACVPARANDFLVLTVNGVNCVTTNETDLLNGPGIAVTAWLWGATTITGPNGSNATPKGPASLNLFTFNKPMDQCTAPLLAMNLNGTHSSSVTMTQYTGATASSKPAAGMVVTLSTSFVASYSVGGDTGDNPTETWTLTFSKICVANKQNGASYCYSTGP
jgi:type VI protein secretion system component Hcp